MGAVHPAPPSPRRLLAALSLGLVGIGIGLDGTYSISSIERASSLPPSC